MYEKIGQSIFVIPALIAMSLGSLGLRPTPPETKASTATPIAVESAEPSSTPSAEPSLNELIEKYFPEKAREMARRISNCESSGNEKALGHNTNGSTDSGYFQINSVHKDRVDGDLSKLMDGETNVRVASEIYKEQGFSPWVCAKKLGIR